VGFVWNSPKVLRTLGEEDRTGALRARIQGLIEGVLLRRMASVQCGKAALPPTC
jgi:hypothetical protein